MTRPNIAITLGDPSGIGPELAAKLLSNRANLQQANIFVLASLDEVLSAATAAGVDIPIVDNAGPDGVQVLDDGTVTKDIKIAEVSREAGERTMHQLRRGIALASEGLVDGLVLMPLNKSALHMAGMHEEDELRWFGKELGLPAEAVTSEINIIDEGLWTARVTSHVALKNVAARVSAERVTATIELLDTLLYVLLLFPLCHALLITNADSSLANNPASKPLTLVSALLTHTMVRTAVLAARRSTPSSPVFVQHSSSTVSTFKGRSPRIPSFWREQSMMASSPCITIRGRLRLSCWDLRGE